MYLFIASEIMLFGSFFTAYFFVRIVNDERVDEIIVSTFPGERSGWLRRDLVQRLRKDTRLPVEHVVAPA